MDVVMLQDWHGVPESVERQIDLLTKYAPNPKRTAILHEPLLNENGYFLNTLRSSEIDDVWPWLCMEAYWGPSNPYKKFYRVLREQGYDVYSLGDTMNLIGQLAKNFKKLVDDYMKNSVDEYYLSNIFDSLKRRISLERE